MKPNSELINIDLNHLDVVLLLTTPTMPKILHVPTIWRKISYDFYLEYELVLCVQASRSPMANFCLYSRKCLIEP